MNTNISDPAGPDPATALHHAPMHVPRVSARDKLLAAAGELFYEEGVHSVGIERVIERAGVAKASLYGNFKGKDDLVRAYLSQRYEARKARVMETLAGIDDPRAKLLGVFDALKLIFAQPNYRGCAFLRASSEMRPESSGRAVCDAARLWIRDLFTDLARQAGAAHPEQLGQQLVLLYDGSSVSAQLDDCGPAAAVAARAMAEQMLDADGAKV